MATMGEQIDTGTDKRYVRREDDGTFGTDQGDVGRSSAVSHSQGDAPDARRLGVRR